MDSKDICDYMLGKMSPEKELSIHIDLLVHYTWAETLKIFKEGHDIISNNRERYQSKMKPSVKENEWKKVIPLVRDYYNGKVSEESVIKIMKEDGVINKENNFRIETLTYVLEQAHLLEIQEGVKSI